MYLIQSWKDSLSLLIPRNLKLFLMVTVKGIKDVYVGALKYFWWFILLYGVGEIFFGNMPLIVSLFDSIWLFILALLVRASVAKKDRSYFVQYSKYFPIALGGMWLILLIFLFLMIFIGFIVYLIKVGNIQDVAEVFHSLQDNILYILITKISGIFIQAWILLSIFFLLDMPLNFKNWVKSIRFGYRMLIHNMPIFVILIGALSILFGFLDWVAIYILAFVPIDSTSILNVLSFMQEPITVALVSNLYIKRLHEQPQLYFKEPQGD